MVILDLDENKRIIGVEVVGASTVLPPALLRSARRP